MLHVLDIGPPPPRKDKDRLTVQARRNRAQQDLVTLTRLRRQDESNDYYQLHSISMTPAEASQLAQLLLETAGENTAGTVEAKATDAANDASDA